MGGEKTVFDLIVDEDNNEREIAIKDFGFPVSSSTPSTTEDEKKDEKEEPIRLIELTLDSSSDNLERTEVEDDRRSKPISIREQVNLNQTKAANKMIIKHDHKRNKKKVEYKIGDGVSAKIPKVDVLNRNAKSSWCYN